MTEEQSGINEEHYSYGEVCRQRDAWRNRAEAAEKRVTELEKREIELGELAWWLNARAKVPEADLRAALEGKP